MLKPAAEVEDRQEDLTCPGKKFMCIVPRRYEEETRGDCALWVSKRQRPSGCMSKVGLQHELCYGGFVQGYHPSGSGLKRIRRA